MASEPKIVKSDAKKRLFSDHLRGGTAVIGATDVLLPSGPVDQQCRRIDGRRHVRKLCLRHRIVGELAAAETAFRREGQSLIQRSPREAERRSTDGHAEKVERFHANAETLAGLAHNRIGGKLGFDEVKPFTGLSHRVDVLQNHLLSLLSESFELGDFSSLGGGFEGFQRIDL